MRITNGPTRKDVMEVVCMSEQCGIRPSEWLELAAERPIEPLTPEEWREAILSTVVEVEPGAVDA